MVRSILGLGSNLGERWVQLSTAVNSLRAFDNDLLVSPVYESAPVGGPTDQGVFLNCVVVLHRPVEPYELLAYCQVLERAAHRVRTERWGPRTLDVDVLWIDGFTSDDPGLVVPHPRMFERAFVLAPLEDVAPDLVDPSWRERLGSTGEVDQVVREVGVLVAAPHELVLL